MRVSRDKWTARHNRKLSKGKRPYNKRPRNTFRNRRQRAGHGTLRRARP